MKNETPLVTETVPGWYMNFLAAIIKQLPRPGQIDQVTAEGWENNQNALKKSLSECLLPVPASVSAEPKSTPSILELVSTTEVAATTSKFVAKDKFKLKRDGGICSYLGDNLKAWFLEGDSKIEEPFVGGKLYCHKLLEAATDLPQKPGEVAIIPQLGGEAKAETTLTEMFSRMAKQSLGKKGVLLTDGGWNIFYIRDFAGVLRAVCVRWGGDGWFVGADSVEDPSRWIDGYLVFSRNSVLCDSVPQSPTSETSVPA